jgi:hypothetical protein
MLSPSVDLRAELADAVAEYQRSADVPQLLGRLDAVTAAAAPDALIVAVEPYRHIPEIAGPVYEKIVAERPADARALVILANAYWLGGRGGEVVGELASRAIAADPANRGAWHLWALSEPDPRARTVRWQQVVTRFPEDDLARASLADNAASLAGAEHDYDALDLAISSYEELWARSPNAEQRDALEKALQALRGWRL